jgi:hypothetical protein
LSQNVSQHCCEHIGFGLVRVGGIATNTSCDPESLQLFIGITYCDQKQKPCCFFLNGYIPWEMENPLRY